MSSVPACTCKSKRHGSSRSLVRRIGSRLPISTGKRIYIRVPGMDSPGVQLEGEFRYEATGQHYTPREEGLTLASYINNPRQLLAKAVDLFQLDPPMEEGEGQGEEEGEELPMEVGGERAGDEDGIGVNDGPGKNKETMEKISALEGELAKLKAQIAIYALAEEAEQSEEAVPAPPPPPPPPVAPPPPATPVFHSSSTIASTPSIPTNGPIQTPGPRPPQDPLTAATPSQPSDMASMLRDIGSVKLRTVNMARSPGGTPLRPTNKGGARGADPSDPASIIAQALRRKFSHRVFKDSPDKENLDRSDASINFGAESPTVKLLK